MIINYHDVSQLQSLPIKYSNAISMSYIYFDDISGDSWARSVGTVDVQGLQRPTVEVKGSLSNRDTGLGRS